MDVVVKNSDGSPIRGIAATMFKLAEDGKPQTIASFREISAAQVPASPLPQGAGGASITYSNVESAHSGAVNILLLDLLNTPATDQAFARSEMLRFLKHLPPQYLCALFVLSGSGLQEIASPTTFGKDLALLAGAVRLQANGAVATEADREQTQDLLARQTSANRGSAYTVANGTGPNVYSSPLSGAATRLSEALTQDQIAVDARNGRRTIEAFRALVRRFSADPNRKNLLWISTQFPPSVSGALEADLAADLYPRALLSRGGENPADNVFLNSQFAVYPISAAGLASTNVGAELAGGGEVDEAGGNTRTNLHQFNDAFNLRYSMDEIASQTGGEASLNTNDLSGAMARIVETGASYYELTYQPGNTHWNKQYRRITVSVDAPHAVLQYRRGYLAGAEPDNPFLSAPTFSSAMQTRTPQATGIAMKATLTRDPEAQSRGFQLRLSVGPEGVSLGEMAGGLKGGEFLLAYSVEQPGAGEPVMKQLRVGLDQDHYRAFLSGGLLLTEHLTVPAGTQLLRIGVEQRDSGRVGTLDLPLTPGR